MQEKDTKTSTPVRSPADSTTEQATALFPTASGASQARVGEPLLEHHGRFQVLKELARGGLGKVSIAVDAQLKRNVAIKEILPERLGNSTLRQRFLAEAEITGLLEHPGVVPIYAFENDIGGEPYYVMRLIQGRTMAHAIRAYHRRPDPLAFRGLLVRFASVCQTIAYAHSKGVIHRDLKPANIMLGDFGETLVLDWGLAKRIETAAPNDSTLGIDSPVLATSASQSTIPPSTDAITSPGELTHEGQVLGTPAYMAPEQARGEECGPAADVYALGAMLHEILANQPPYAGRTPAEVLDQVRRGLATEIDTRSQPPRALVAICRKAMARVASERYATPIQLAEDVDRWLADEPVTTFVEPWTVKAARWARRHPRLVSGMAASLLVGFLGIAVGLGAVERERQRTAFERDEKGKALAAESQARQLEFEALRSLADDVVEDLMARNSTLTPENAEFLRKIIRHYEAFAAMAGEDAERVSIRAEGNYAVGDMRLRLGDIAGAEAALREALALYEQLSQRFPTHPEWRYYKARTLGNMAIVCEATGRLADMDSAYENSLTIQRQLVTEFPTEVEFRRGLAKLQNNLANVHLRYHRLSEAEAAYRQAQDIKRQLAAEFPKQLMYRQELANGHNNLGLLLRQQGRTQEAEVEFLNAITLQRQLVAEVPPSPQYRGALAGSCDNLAISLGQRGQLEEAEAAYREALALYKQLADEFPAKPEFRVHLARSMGNWSAFLGMTGRLQDAELACKEVLAVQQRLADEFPNQREYRQQLGVSHDKLGYLLQRNNQRKEAEAAYRKSLELLRPLASELSSSPELNSQTADTYNNFGLLLQELGRLQEADSAFREAATLQRQLTTAFPDQPSLRLAHARTLNNIASVSLVIGKPSGAESIFNEAVAIQRALVRDYPEIPEYHFELAGTLGNLANLQNERREFRAALAFLDEAKPHHEAALQANAKHPGYRQFYRNWLWILTVTHSGLHDQEGARRAAEQLRDLGWDPIKEAFTAALALANCIPVVEQADPASAQDREAARQFYGALAVGMLRTAMEQGYKDLAEVRGTTAFVPLRRRVDFQKLLLEMEGIQ